MVEQNFDEESNLDLRQYIDALIRWSWVAIIVALLAGAGAYFYTQTRTPVYQASSLVQIQQTQGSALPTFSDLQLSRALASTYKELITTKEWGGARSSLMRNGVLSRMQELGFVERQKEGRNITYHLTENGNERLIEGNLWPNARVD